MVNPWGVGGSSTELGADPNFAGPCGGSRAGDGDGVVREVHAATNTPVTKIDEVQGCLRAEAGFLLSALTTRYITVREPRGIFRRLIG